MATNLQKHIIVEEYDERAVYKLKTIPEGGDLLLNGTKMAPGDIFTQSDIRQGKLAYKHTRDEGRNSASTDSFDFVVMLDSENILTSKAPRSQCMPPASIPLDGIYTYDIRIKVIPYPSVVNNKGLTLMAGEEKCIGSNLRYSNQFSDIDDFTYEITSVSNGMKGTKPIGSFTLNGQPLLAGTKLNQTQMGQLCYKANANVDGAPSFNFTVCNQAKKCTTGSFKVTVKDWPSPVVDVAKIKIDECEATFTLGTLGLSASVSSGSTDEQITFSFTDDPTNLSRVEPKTFTQQDIIDGNVKVFHDCTDADLSTREFLKFNVCTQRGKCVSSTLQVDVEPLPVIAPEPESEVVVNPETGCVWKFDQLTGMFEPVSPCGLWAEVSGRQMPVPSGPEDLGTLYYYPNAFPPITLLNLKGEGIVKSPVMVPLQPTAQTAPPLSVAPHQDGSVPPGVRFKAPDGTIWVGDNNGKWIAQKGTVPGGDNKANLNYDPIIKAGEYGLITNQPSNLPASERNNDNGIIYDTPNLPLEKTSQGFMPIVTETFGVDNFIWFGDNEHWLPNGQAATLRFFSNRMYTRFDIMPATGYTLHRTTSNDFIGGNQYLLSAFDYVNWGGIEGHAWAQSMAKHPHEEADYYVVTSDRRVFLFTAAIQPRLVPEYGGVTGTTKRWSYRSDYQFDSSVMSFAGNFDSNSDYRLATWCPDQEFRGASEMKINAAGDNGGNKYGSVYLYNHFESWLLYRGWQTAQLTMFVERDVEDQYQQQWGGPFNVYPTENATYRFNVRAYDVVTGEENFRPFAVHFNSTGRAPNGATSMLTDQPFPKAPFIPPQGGKAFCRVLPGDEVGECKYY